MTSLAVCCPKDSPGKGDGRYFVGLARRWQERHGGRVILIDATMPKPLRFRAMLAAIEADQPDMLAVFDHGLAACLPRLGATCTPFPGLGMPDRNVDTLGAALALGGTAVHVVLFACLTGEDRVSGPDGPPGGDGGFADQLRDAMVKAGCTGAQVDAHGSSSQSPHRIRDYGGDAVANPFVRRFAGPEDKEHVGGAWLIEPGGTNWRRWDSWLDHGGWLSFPYMTGDQIRATLDREGDHL